MWIKYCVCVYMYAHLCRYIVYARARACMYVSISTANLCACVDICVCVCGTQHTRTCVFSSWPSTNLSTSFFMPLAFHRNHTFHGVHKTIVAAAKRLRIHSLSWIIDFTCSCCPDKLTVFHCRNCCTVNVSWWCAQSPKNESNSLERILQPTSSNNWIAICFGEGRGVVTERIVW